MNFKVEKIAVISDVEEFKTLARFLYNQFGAKIDRITRSYIQVGKIELKLKQTDEECFGCQFDALVQIARIPTKLNIAAIKYLKLHSVEVISRDDLINLVEEL
jgi:hypothetical protein